MQEHRMQVMVPANRRATIEFPETIRSGPVELIVRVPSADQADREAADPKVRSPQGRGRIAALAAELARDPRSFRELFVRSAGCACGACGGSGAG